MLCRPKAVIVNLACICSAGAVSAETIDTAFQAHVRAVQTRDLRALERTVTSSDALVLILPNGTRTETKQAYLDFHRGFFESRSWKIDFQVLSQLKSSDTALVLTRSTYTDLEQGKPIRSQSWVTFVFRLEDKGWRLVYDQNTRLPVPARLDDH